MRVVYTLKVIKLNQQLNLSAILFVDIDKIISINILFNVERKIKNNEL